MTRVFQTLALLAAAVALAAGTAAAQTASIQADFMKDWTGQKDALMKIADAMPEAKYNFKATPAQRDFGGHVMHIAQINMLVMKAMADTFDYGSAILKEQTDQTMVGAVAGPPWMGPSTRARIFEFLVGHTQDTYGQMVVYLRLNGLVPPASQRP